MKIKENMTRYKIHHIKISICNKFNTCNTSNINGNFAPYYIKLKINLNIEREREEVKK